jgi:hypothetical protein
MWIVATAPRPLISRDRRSTRGASGPRSTTSRNASPPRSSASERKYAQRTMCSVLVGPDAPNASLGDGAGARTPNVKTPAVTWPSLASTCQRTV